MPLNNKFELGSKTFRCFSANAASLPRATRQPVGPRQSSNMNFRDFRRPDVIVLERGCVVVVELKGALHPSQAALDQALGYARDLAAYHAACAGHSVIPVLVNRGSDPEPVLRDSVYVVAPAGLDLLLDRLSEKGETNIPVSAFLAPDSYAPLPQSFRPHVNCFRNGHCHLLNVRGLRLNPRCST